MDFGPEKEAVIEIHGNTALSVNAVTIRMTGRDGQTLTEIADFTGQGGSVQSFPVHVPGGLCSVSFVFLPGSQFDFYGFRFQKLDRN